MENLHHHKILFLDIETVPTVEAYSDLSVPMQELWAHKSSLLDKENEDYGHTFYERAGIFAEFGKIVCISVGFFYKTEGEERFRLKSFIGEEIDLLRDFFELVTQLFRSSFRAFCGHNIKEFDIPYICRRGLICGLSLPNVFSAMQAQKPWESPLIDTLQLWKFGDYKNYTSLNLLAQVLDIETPKGDISGKDVAHVFYKEKNIDRIASYCMRDVVTTARIYRKLKGEKTIGDEQIETK